MVTHLRFWSCIQHTHRIRNILTRQQHFAVSLVIGKITRQRSYCKFLITLIACLKAVVVLPGCWLIYGGSRDQKAREPSRKKGPVDFRVLLIWFNLKVSCGLCNPTNIVLGFRIWRLLCLNVYVSYRDNIPVLFCSVASISSWHWVILVQQVWALLNKLYLWIAHFLYSLESVRTFYILWSGHNPALSLSLQNLEAAHSLTNCESSHFSLDLFYLLKQNYNCSLIHHWFALQHAHLSI